MGKVVADIRLGDLQGAAEFSCCCARFIYDYVQQSLAGGFHSGLFWEKILANLTGGNFSMFLIIPSFVINANNS
jgi:hypothetical protein